MDFQNLCDDRCSCKYVCLKLWLRYVVMFGIIVLCTWNVYYKHKCFKYGNIPANDGGQIYLSPMTANKLHKIVLILCSTHYVYDTVMKEDMLKQGFFTRSIFLFITKHRFYDIVNGNAMKSATISNKCGFCVISWWSRHCMLKPNYEFCPLILHLYYLFVW